MSGKSFGQGARYIAYKAATGNMSYTFNQWQGWLKLRIVAAVDLEQLLTEAFS